jgi:hypothetical protein
MKSMAGSARGAFGGFAALLGVARAAPLSLLALSALGCDTGGLLVATGTNIDKPELVGHSSTEIVSGGTVASNGKYKVVYTLGQPSPMQGVATSPDHRVNGGLVGAVQDK